MKSRPVRGLALVASISLALACGGGGSGGESGDGAEIDAANAEAIASEVTLALTLTSQLSTIGGGITQAALSSAAAAPAAEGEPALVVALRAALAAAGERLPTLAGAGGIAANAVLDPTTVDCDTSGTFTVSGDVGPGAISPGDRIDVRFDACVNEDSNEDDLPQLDGSLSYTVLAFSGHLDDLFSLTLDATFTDLTLTLKGDTFLTKGRATTTYDTTAPPRVQSSISGSSLEFLDGSHSLLLRNFETSFTQDTADDDYQIRGDARATSTSFVGEAGYEATNPLAGPAGDPADEGVVEVRGASDSVLQIVPLTGFNVDFGTAYAPPPKTFGAAAGQVGRWTQIGLGETVLASLRGEESRVRLSLDASTASGAAAQPTNDAQRLLNDQFSSPKDGVWSVTFSGLADDDLDGAGYRVFLYAPTDTSVDSGAMNVGGVSVASIPGDPGGALSEGMSWKSVDDPVKVSGGTLTITGSDAANASGLAGLQLVPGEEEGVNLEIDTDGNGETDITIQTTWTCLMSPSSPGC